MHCSTFGTCDTDCTLSSQICSMGHLLRDR